MAKGGRRLAGLLVLSAALATSGGLGVGPACVGHECDLSIPPPYGDKPGEGNVNDVDPTEWESTPMDKTWVAYPGQAILTFHYQGVFPNCPVPQDPVAYISPDPNPTTNSNNWTIASGNLAEFTYYPPLPQSVCCPDAGPGASGPVQCPVCDYQAGELLVHNDTCGNYYIRVTFPCPLTAPPDAGAGADAGEGGEDAPAEASGSDAAADAPGD